MEITFNFSILRFIEDDTALNGKTERESGQIRFRYINPGSDQVDFNVIKDTYMI
jgi:hypothetical protein